MINKDEIVAITKSDLLSMYATICNSVLFFNDSSTATILHGVNGHFEIDADATGHLITDAPVKSLDISSSSNANALFVADYDFEGFLVDGEAVTPIDAAGNELTNEFFRNSGMALLGVTYTNSHAVIVPVTPMV